MRQTRENPSFEGIFSTIAHAYPTYHYHLTCWPHHFGGAFLNHIMGGFFFQKKKNIQQLPGHIETHRKLTKLDAAISVYLADKWHGG